MPEAMKLNSGTKRVYVRHLDVTGLEINANSINKADRLAGKGEATKNGTETISKLSEVFDGYQEVYEIGSSDSLEVFRDPDSNYNCVGSNVKSAGDANIQTVRNKMDEFLNRSNVKYDTLSTNSRTIPNAIDDVYLVDFYYTSKNTGTLIEREKIGRLAFYTTDESSNFKNTVDNHTNSNTQLVYDVIPSSETLRLSVDNAYTYMLGAINIVEQTKEGTYEFDYTLAQNYKVNYTVYKSKCDACGYTYTKKNKNDSCSQKVDDLTTGTKKTCGSTNYSYSSYISTYDSKKPYTIKYSYAIPYQYTYYKVKNLRLYNISKIELSDGYNNKGLPLFDGNTYTVQTSEQYNTGFTDGANFDISSSKETVNRTSKTLSTTLEYTFDNDDNVTDTKIKKYAEDKITKLFDKLSKEDAAKLEEFNLADGDYVPDLETSEHLKATLSVKNDEISFMDNIKNTRIYLVGQDVSKVANGNYTRSEKEATQVIDLSTYTGEEKVEVATVYPKSTTNKYLPQDSLTNTENGGRDYFEQHSLTIPTSRLNGKRYSYGKIYYNLLSENKVLNFDVDDSKVENGNHEWNNEDNRTAVNGDAGNTFVDTEMHNTEGTTPKITLLIKPGMLSNITWEYGKNNDTDADVVDVFTPVAFSTKVLGDSDKDIRVDHTILNNNSSQDKQIQKNSRFTIQITATNKNSTYTSVSTSKYLNHYYIKFNFDVQNIKITDAKGTNRTYESNSAAKDNWIGPIYNKYNGVDVGTVTVSAFALADPNEASGVVNQEQNEYEVRAVAVNTPTKLDYDVLRGRIRDLTKYITSSQNRFSGTSSTNQDHQEYYEQKNIYGQSNYIADDVVETENISRVYDFKITDIKDIDWKNIFRTSTTTTTNVHSGKAYYSGVKKWNIYTTLYNNMVTRDVAEIGATKQQILPVGPYKHTNSTYVKAPKLGYKFSFDLKTTGANANKRIVITPSFYYIKKDATGYTEDIKLYYKNSSNKYVDISNYKLYFVPDDGYRLTFKETDQAYRFSSSTISKNTVLLGTAKELILKSNMMEQADNNFMQIWYGEYKLPNSTIVVGKGADGKYNINRDRLTDGYIGIKFDIKVYEYRSSSMTEGNISKILSYSQNNKNASQSTNTSQWDYEGYLGFSNPGSAARNIKISLERGVWTLNDEMYNKIKGTVMLYDTDATAASDYE